MLTVLHTQHEPHLLRHETIAAWVKDDGTRSAKDLQRFSSALDSPLIRQVSTFLFDYFTCFVIWFAEEDI
jgi:hypothetical protein